MSGTVVSADEIIITDRLNGRPSRLPDHATESRALEALVRELAEHPENLLQKLADTIVELGIGDSAGVSIEESGEVRQFRWVALAGVWSQLRGSTIRFDASPCGLAVQREQLLLIESPERFFAEAQVEPLIHEGLLVPFHVNGRPVGTLWINVHSPDRTFDREDARLLQGLARFASAGYQMILALQSSEAGRLESDIRLRALAHASSDAFYVMSADMRELRELSGGNFIPDATSPSRDWLRDYIPPEDHALTLAAIRGAIETKGVFELEHRVRRADGEAGWAMSRAVPIFGADGEIVEWFGAASDVTARKRAEIAQRESETRLAAAFASVPVGLAVIDMDGHVVTGNDEYRRFLPRGTIPSRDPGALGQWRAWDAEGRPLQPGDFPGARAIRGERVVPGQEMLYATGDGREVWTSVSSVPIRDASGRITAQASVISDIDDAKRTADALREREARYRSLFQSIDDGYALIEFLPEEDGQPPDFRFLEVNGSFERQTGNQDVTGKLGSEINPGDDAVWIQTFGEVARFRLPRRFEIHHQQTGRWYDAFATPVGDAGSRQVCVVFADTTDRKAREKRQAFQLTLNDTLRPLVDAVEIMEVASEALGRHLNVGRCAYCEVDETGDYFTVDRDWTDGVMHSYVGRHFFGFGDQFLEQYRAGKNVVIYDALADARAAGGEAAFEAAGGVRASIGIPLIKEGRFAAGFFVQQVEPRHWTAQEEALTREIAERVWAAVERARVEAALGESEKKHRTLFETMGQGYGEVEIVRDADGRAVDHRYVEINPAYERLVGIPAAQARGRLASEIIPGLEPSLHEAFGRIARGGVPEQFEVAVGPLDCWFSVFAYPQGGDRLILLYEDVTDRKRAETALRESEERQAFLLKLSDTLRPLTDANVIKENASRLLGEHLGVDRAGYVDLYPDVEQADIQDEGWLALGVPSAAGVYRTATFHGFADQLLRGETAVMEDSLDDPRVPQGSWDGSWGLLDVRAAVSHALMKDDRLAASFYVHSIAPRRWSEAEISLIVEVGERTWEAMERARAEAALRVSEERLLQFGEASQDVLWIRDAATLQWTYLTPAFETIYGLQRAEALSGDDYRNWQDIIVPDDRAQAVAAIERVLGGEWVTFEYRVQRPSDGAIRWLRNTDFPISDEAGKVVAIGGVGHDMTDLKAVQAAIAASEGRLRTLMEGIPQLVWRSCANGRWTWASPQWLDFTGQRQEESHGLGWLDAVHPDDHEATMLAWEDAKPHGMLDAEYRVRRAADGDWLWHHTRSVPVRDASGNIIEWLGTTTDVHALRELQERQGVLVAELQHRTRNLMGVVRSTTESTLRSSESLDDFAPRFRDRIGALARVNGLLSRLDEHDRVTFDEVIDAEMAALGQNGGSGQVTLDGPKGIALRSSTVQTFALALHELATNAVKYGALGPSGGHLAVRWRLERPDDDGQPWLHVEWTETGVAMLPADAKPQGGGAGRALIERALPYQLGAKTSYVMASDGVRCSISLPVSARTGGSNGNGRENLPH